MIKISGAWTNPEVVGQCMMLIGSFVMEKLSNTSAIMFGGSELDSAAGSVYIVDISISIEWHQEWYVDSMYICLCVIIWFICMLYSP